MMSDFPPYDPDAAYGDPSAPGGDARRTNYPDLETMLAADPYQVAAVLLRSVFQPLAGTIIAGRADSSRLTRGAEDCVRELSRGLFATLSGNYPAGFLEVIARSLAIWSNALVAESMELGSGRVTILIEPAALELSDADLVERLRSRR